MFQGKRLGKTRVCNLSLLFKDVPCNCFAVRYVDVENMKIHLGQNETMK